MHSIRLFPANTRSNSFLYLMKQRWWQCSAWCFKYPSFNISSITNLSPCSNMNSAKRIILRIREADVNWTDPFEPVWLCLEKKGHSIEEITNPLNHHFVHLQPPSDIPKRDPKIHIVIDVNKDQFPKTFVDDDFPHEMYRIRYLDDKMWVLSSISRQYK